MFGTWVRKPSPRSVAVVFVHGVLSSGEKCWRHPNGVFWPDVLAVEQGLRDFGVYSFTYRTGIFSGSYSIGDAMNALKEHLQLDGILEACRIVFVCHSMGGIVVRKYLVDRAADLIERDISVGLFLVASPSLGSAYADWLSPLAKLMGHSQADALRFVRDNVWLMDLDSAFMNLKESGRLRINGKELIEDRFIVGGPFLRKQAVEPFAGARYFGEHYKVPDSDHSSIACVENSSAMQHRLLVQFLQNSVPDVQAPVVNASSLVARLHAMITRPEDGEDRASAAYLLYVSRDRVASLFHQVDAQTLQAGLSTNRSWLLFSEPNASSGSDRSRRALVSQLGTVLTHIAKCAVVTGLEEAVRDGRLSADWYIVCADFESEGWDERAGTQRLFGRVGDVSLVLTCTTSNFSGVVEEHGAYLPTSTSAILFTPGRTLKLAALVRIAAFSRSERMLEGTALFLALRPLDLTI